MNTTTTTNPDNPIASPKSQPGLMDKLKQINSAWEQIAPEAKFGNMILMEFQSVTGASQDTRRQLEGLKSRLASLARTRRDNQAKLQTALKQVRAAVLLDPKYGENSPLYRAMGFVLSSERKPRSKAQTQAGSTPTAAEADASAQKSQPSLVERFQKMLVAWQATQAEAIGGLALEGWKPAGDALVATQAKYLEELTTRRSLVAQKKLADAQTKALLKKVVASVVASPAYGETSPLYRAMGYVPVDERKSARKEPTAAAAAPVAAGTPAVVPAAS